MAETVKIDDLSGLEVLRAPVWIYDLDLAEFWWANRSALRMFCAESFEALVARQRHESMTEGMQRRLDNYRFRFARGEELTEQWTFYPAGEEPVLAECTFSGVRIADDRGERQGMLVEARPSGTAGDERRLVEALRHCNELISLYRPDGSLILRNPAAETVLGSFLRKTAKTASARVSCAARMPPRLAS